MLRPVRCRKWVITPKKKEIHRRDAEDDRKWRQEVAWRKVKKSTPQHLTGLIRPLARPRELV